MVEKTKRALAILQKRGCTSPASVTNSIPNLLSGSLTTATNGASNSVSNQISNNLSIVNSHLQDTSVDKDGTLKRLSGEIIRATEDKVAEVKRKAGELLFS